MPIPVATTTVTRPPRGAGGAAGPPQGEPVFVTLAPVQVAGLTPLWDCTATDCRNLPAPCCERRLVLGGTGEVADSTGPPTYEKDFNSFLIDVSLYGPNALATTVSIILQKCSGTDTWTTVADLDGADAATYGTYFALNSSSTHPTYFGYRISWARVLALLGRGIYRLRFNTSMRTLSGCLISDEFDVRKFTCGFADGTVKFESFIKGKIGDANRTGRVFDLCGINTSFGAGSKYEGWYDSVRLPGFFGYQKIPEYLEVMREYQTGLQERISDEAIYSFQYSCTDIIGKPYLDRLGVYGLMADTLWVSDYNSNNSDYYIDRLLVVKDGGYEPDYKDRLRRRGGTVTVKFKAGVQNVIKSICCPVRG